MLEKVLSYPVDEATLAHAQLFEIGADWRANYPGRQEWFQYISSGEEVFLLQDLMQSAQTYMSSDDTMFVERGVAVVLEAHFGQKRISDGLPQSRHLFTTGRLATYFHLRPTGVAKALVHDTIEDNRNFTKDIVAARLGADVARSAERLSKDTSDEETAFKIVEAAVDDLETAVVKILDQFDNMRTAGVTKSMPKKARRVRELIAPLAESIGLPEVSTVLLNRAARAEYPQQTKAIEMHLQEEQGSVGILRELEIAAAIRSVALTDPSQRFYMKEPNLYEMLQSTQFGKYVDKSTIAYHVDLPYDSGRIGEGASFLANLCQTFNTDPASSFNDLFETGQASITLMIDGGPVHIRILSTQEYDFQHTSLLPLVQSEGSYTAEQYAAAQAKHTRWRESFERRKDGQTKSYTQQEFIDFLQGEQQVTVFAKDGKILDLPRGATYYDYLCRQGLHSVLLQATHVLSTGDGRTVQRNLRDKLLPGETIDVKKSKGRTTLNVDALDHVHTRDGLSDVQGHLRDLRRNELRRIKEALGLTEEGDLPTGDYSDQQLLELRQKKRRAEREMANVTRSIRLRGKNILLAELSKRMGGTVEDIPFERGMKAFEGRYRSSFLTDAQQLMLEDVGLGTMPPPLIEDFLRGMQDYITKKLDLITVSVLDVPGAIHLVTGSFAARDVSIVTQRMAREGEDGSGTVKLQLYIEKGDDARRKQIIAELKGHPKVISIRSS